MRLSRTGGGLVLFCFSVPTCFAPLCVVRGTNKRLFDLLRYPREIGCTVLWKNIQARECKGVLSANVCRILVGNSGYDFLLDRKSCRRRCPTAQTPTKPTVFSARVATSSPVRLSVLAPLLSNWTPKPHTAHVHKHWVLIRVENFNKAWITAA